MNSSSAVTRLSALLDARPPVVSKTDFDGYVGWAPSWRWRLLKQEGNAVHHPLPLEVLALTLQLPGVTANTFEGTNEHALLRALPSHVRRFIEGVAAYNLSSDGDPITRQNAAAFFAEHGVTRPPGYWRKLLDGVEALPADAGSLTKLAETLKLAPSELGVPVAPTPSPSQLAWTAVDQLVDRKLKNIRNGGRRWTNDYVEGLTKDHLAAEVKGGTWEALTEDQQLAIVKAVAPIAIMNLIMADTRTRPKITTAVRSPEELLQLVTEILPVVDEAIEPAAKRLEKAAPNGEMVQNYARALEVDVHELALLLSGLGSADRFPVTAEKLRQKTMKSRKPRQRKKGIVINSQNRPEVAPTPMPKATVAPFRRAWDLDVDQMVAIVRGQLRKAGRPLTNAELAELLKAQLGCGGTKAQQIIAVAGQYGMLKRTKTRRYTLEGM